MDCQRAGRCNSKYRSRQNIGRYYSDGRLDYEDKNLNDLLDNGEDAGPDRLFNVDEQNYQN